MWVEAESVYGRYLSLKRVAGILSPDTVAVRPFTD